MPGGVYSVGGRFNSVASYQLPVDWNARDYNQSLPYRFTDAASRQNVSIMDGVINLMPPVNDTNF